jgi:hypothetical protein
MCGIFGLVMHKEVPATEAAPLFKLFNTLAVLSAERGTDATGMAHVWVNGEGYVEKSAVASYQMVRRKAWNAFQQDEAWRGTFALMGHTRRATHGLAVSDNAHPFVFTEPGLGSLFGTHNGVIRNHHQYAPTQPFAVDSANLLWYLAGKPGAKWGDALFRVQGSYALALARGDKFTLCRNGGSPCYRAYLPQFDTTAYASTEHMLRAALALAGVTAEAVISLLPGTFYEWTVNGSRTPREDLYDKYAEWDYTYGGTGSVYRGGTGAYGTGAWRGAASTYAGGTTSKPSTAAAAAAASPPGTGTATQPTVIDAVMQGTHAAAAHKPGLPGMPSTALPSGMTTWCEFCRTYARFTDWKRSVNGKACCDKCMREMIDDHMTSLAAQQGAQTTLEMEG